LWDRLDLADPSASEVGHDWGFHTEPTRDGRRIKVARGKVVGGSSAVNSVFALRGNARDLCGWSEAGNPGWGFAEVLPSFRRIEHDLDKKDHWHGSDGPVPIRRYSGQEMTPIQRVFVESAQALGHRWVDDLNGA
jgi:choline dehydrogenase